MSVFVSILKVEKLSFVAKSISSNIINSVFYYMAPMAKFCLFIISIDRIYAMRFPIEYKTRDHKRFALATAIGIMIVCGIMGSATIYSANIWNGKRNNTQTQT
jgi:hypothetical protein